METLRSFNELRAKLSVMEKGGRGNVVKLHNNVFGDLWNGVPDGAGTGCGCPNLGTNSGACRDTGAKLELYKYNYTSTLVERTILKELLADPDLMAEVRADPLSGRWLHPRIMISISNPGGRLLMMREALHMVKGRVYRLGRMNRTLRAIGEHELSTSQVSLIVKSCRSIEAWGPTLHVTGMDEWAG